MSDTATVDAGVATSDASTVQSTGSTTDDNSHSATLAGETPIFSEGLNFRDGWYESIDSPSFDPYRATAARFKSLDDVFKSLHETKAKLSEKTDGMVKAPGPASTDEDRAAFREAIGVPADANGYDAQLPDKLPEGVEINSDEMAPFREKAHELGLTPDQFNGLLNWQIQREGQMIQEDLTQRSVAEAQAKQEMQMVFGNQMQEKLMLAQRAAATVGLDPQSVKTDPQLAVAMAKLSELIGPDRLIPSDEVKGTLSAQSQARDIMTNPNNPLHAKYRDGDAAVRKEVLAMLERGD